MILLSSLGTDRFLGLFRGSILWYLRQGDMGLGWYWAWWITMRILEGGSNMLSGQENRGSPWALMMTFTGTLLWRASTRIMSRYKRRIEFECFIYLFIFIVEWIFYCSVLTFFAVHLLKQRTLLINPSTRGSKAFILVWKLEQNQALRTANSYEFPSYVKNKK